VSRSSLSLRCKKKRKERRKDHTKRNTQHLNQNYIRQAHICFRVSLIFFSFSLSPSLFSLSISFFFRLRCCFLCLFLVDVTAWLRVACIGGGVDEVGLPRNVRVRMMMMMMQATFLV